MDAKSLEYDIESEDFHKYIAEDVETKFNIIWYSKDNNRPLLKGKDKNIIGMIKKKKKKKKKKWCNKQNID